jgi:hypothetical protein
VGTPLATLPWGSNPMRIRRTSSAPTKGSSSCTRLDRCAAFDDAVVDLQNHDPMWDGGAFGEPAVTRRQRSAASALSNDYLAVDGRLDRIRLQGELALAPQDAPERKN